MINSFKKNKKGIILMLMSSLLVCFGQLFWKLFNNGNVYYLIIGFCLYGLGALFMLFAYKHGSLSVLQPLLSCNYIFTILIAYFILGEPLGIIKILGIIIIFCGVIFIGGGEE